MIEYHFEFDFHLNQLANYTDWLTRVIENENRSVGQLNYVFCSDEYLLQLNQEYLQHDTFTDIITFDYSEGDEVSGDIYISVERVRDNAIEWREPFERELQRVMVHGVLHMLGYKDKTKEEREEMRSLEEDKINMFHVEQ
ncbi:MAG: rRNA maturation RNase YbeY [Flavobacteriaceae bacterium]